MPEPQVPRVQLRELRQQGSLSLLEAYLDAHGDLVLEGYDRGPDVAAHFGDSDYEYWRRVRQPHVARVLLELLKDRFDSDVTFHQWLQAKGIPDEFSSWT